MNNTTPHNNEALEVGQEVSLFDCRWKIEGIHLGALGQESLIELRSLTHKAGWTGQWEYHPMVFVPEPFVRVVLTRANQRASEAPPTAQGGEGDAEALKELNDLFYYECPFWVSALKNPRLSDKTMHTIRAALTHPREQQREDEGLDYDMLIHSIKCYDEKKAVEKYTWHDNFKTILEAARRYARQSSGRGEGDDAFYELCSQCWDALGITEYTGKHIVEHIRELKEQAALKQSPTEKMGEVDKIKAEIVPWISRAIPQRAELKRTEIADWMEIFVDHLLSQGIISGGK